ncbi:sulfotransferase family 2 domain-containing protein [Anabaena sp. UHCC 0451]|uniref:sulfotransferase family 2 domain-containing protein n=1 Tax=Anabaena sp. UHCC 0451 TaxID=2055235 RepID=UPI002B1EA7D2|nr:sulfotransferase family 2 domain-containing protein [Anabaena sp. UHCC 0451]MEA5577335.1 sulfotransferase family 2 domain-containing protein [Anabaena sp. UHCC 0451]
MNLNQDLMEDPLVIFTHIQKTAGTTLQSIIKQNYRSNQIITVPHRQPFSEVIESVQNQVNTSKIKIIQGHIGFGLHNYLPKSYGYITLLRDPVQRVISSYYFRQTNPDTKPMTLEEFCLARESNAMTKWLSGLEFPYQVSIGFKDLKKAKEEGDTRLINYHNQDILQLLELAKQNLKDNFKVIGITEKFDETLILMKHYLGWRNIYYYRQRVATNKPPESAFSPEILTFIQKHNQFDIQLYEYALELFNKQINEYGSFFEEDLQKFQTFNSVIGKVYAGSDKVRQILRIKSHINRLFSN